MSCSAERYLHGFPCCILLWYTLHMDDVCQETGRSLEDPYWTPSVLRSLSSSTFTIHYNPVLDGDGDTRDTRSMCASK
ncbi:unnamed protein product [Peniophora sp. CBMAI 1063]|nr:unnamed protein product [Peniophora sp. CBMAI 1063]